MLFSIKPLTKPEKEKAAEHFHCQYSPSPFNFLKKVLSVLLVVTKSLRCFRKLFKKIALFVKCKPTIPKTAMANFFNTNRMTFNVDVVI